MSTGHAPDFIGTSDRYKRNELSRKSSAKSCSTIIVFLLHPGCLMSWQRLHIESVRIHQRTRPTADQPHASTRTAAEMEPRFFFLVQDFLSFSPVFGCPGASIGVQRRSFSGEWGRSWLPEIPLQLPWHRAIFSLQTTWHQLGHGAILD